MQLDWLPAEEQRKLGRHSIVKGRLPRGWRSGGTKTMSVPWEDMPMAVTLLRRRGRVWLEGFGQVILDVLTRPPE